MPSGAAAAVSGHSCRDTRLCQARRLRGQPCRAAVSGAAFIHQAPPHATTPGPKATTGVDRRAQIECLTMKILLMPLHPATTLIVK